MAKKPYHVVPDKKKGKKLKWGVKRAGAKQYTSKNHRKKRAAVKKAKKTGYNQRVGVVVHRKDGTVQYGYDYEGIKRSLGRS